MKVKSLCVELENSDDSVHVNIEDGKYAKFSMSIQNAGENWEVYLGNEHEERMYSIVRTKHGGYRLRERTLL